MQGCPRVRVREGVLFDPWGEGDQLDKPLCWAQQGICTALVCDVDFKDVWHHDLTLAVSWFWFKHSVRCLVSWCD